MEVTPDAPKHGTTDEDMHHAVRHAIRAVELEDADKTLLIGADRAGRLLEVVVADLETGRARIIQAMRLRARADGRGFAVVSTPAGRLGRPGGGRVRYPGGTGLCGHGPTGPGLRGPRLRRERGEFHTYVWDAPEFAAPIPVQVGERVDRDNLVFADLLPVRVT